MAREGFSPYHERAIAGDLGRAKFYLWSGSERLVMVNPGGPAAIASRLLAVAIERRRVDRLGPVILASEVGFSTETVAFWWHTQTCFERWLGVGPNLLSQLKRHQ
jgi:hypothetical protein